MTDATGTVTSLTDARVVSKRGNHLTSDVGDRRVSGNCVPEDDKLYIYFEGTRTSLTVPAAPGSIRKSTFADAGSVRTPMPCKISSVSVKAGDTVKKGQTLVILEAMKMEHVIKSPKSGVIKKVYFAEGELVGENKALVSFEE